MDNFTCLHFKKQKLFCQSITAYYKIFVLFQKDDSQEVVDPII